MRFAPPAGVTARPRAPTDTEFLAELYAAGRAAELAQVPWPEPTKRAFLRSQFAAQTQHYDAHYGDAEFLVLERDGQPIGRVTLQWNDRDVHVVDLALVPSCRGHGLGTEVLRAVQAQSPGTVGIAVEQHNPALRLYERLGFQRVRDDGVYYQLRWHRDLAPGASVG